MMNENAMANVLVDVDFLEEQFKSAGRPNLVSLFSELRAVRPPSLSIRIFFFQLGPLQTISIVLSDSVAEFLVPSRRQTTFANIKPKKLTAVLEKLARYGGSCRDQLSRERGEKRRKEADAVGRLFPGEGR